MTNSSCPIYFDSVVKINNNTELSYSLNVSGSTTLADTVASTLNVTGATTLASTLNVTGATTLAGTLSVDTINEKTGNNGVVIESVTLKDGNLQGSTITATNFNVGSRNIISGSAQGSFTDLELKNNNGVKLLIDGDTGDIQGYGTLNITGATTLESTLSVDTINEKTGNNGVIIESVTLKDGNLQGSTITATNFNVGSRNIISGSAQGSFTDLELKNNNGVKLLIDGDTGDIQGYGTLNITGATTLKSTLNVSGATTLADTITSTLNVTGATTLADTITSTLNVTGATTLSDTIASTLNVTGATTLADTIASTLNVTGSTTLADTVASTLNVTGATTLSDTIASTLNVTGATTLTDTIASTLNVTGATTLASTLNVTGATTLTDTIASTLNVTGATTLSDTIASTLNVTGATTLTDTIASTLNVTGATTLASTLNVTGATTLKSTLNVSGATTLADAITSTLNVTGATTLSDTVASTLNVTGATTLADTIASTLNVTGATTLSDTVASTLNVTGATTLADTITSTLNVTGATTLSAIVSNTLNVTGATTLANIVSSTLNVTGATTLADTITSTLNVTGTTDTIINNFTIKNDGELDPGTTGLSINNIDNIGALSDYKTLLYNNNTKQVRWTNTSSSSSSDTLTIDTTGIPTLTTSNTGKYYINTVGNTQQLRFRIKTGTTSYQDLLIGTYDTVDPTIVLPEGTNIFKSVNDTFNDTINVSDAGITETITFGTTSYPYNTDISTQFGSIRANLALSGNSQSAIDMSTTNLYTINYIATDNSGNIKEVVRTLNILVSNNFYHNYYNLNSSINSDYGIINGNLVGYAVAMNTGGNYLAYSKNNSNKIVIKKETGNVWSIYGDYITTTNIQTIVNIQFDNIGNKLLFNDIPSTGNSKLYIYTNNGSDFNNLLQTIQLNYLITNDVNNHNSISISGDGNIILVSESSGYICIYKLDQTSNQYEKHTQTMGNGTSHFGFSTSIDNLGNKLIIGAPLHDADNGKICLYNFSNNDYINNTIPTPTEFTFSTLGLISGYNKIGYDVSISDTGRFAFSAPFANENSKTYSGCVFIYENDNTLLTKINGYDNYMGFGTKIELSKNGSVITITARDSYNNNLNTSTGFIKMYYEYQEKTATTDSVWLEIDHKNIYSDTSDIDIYYGYSSALDYSGTKLFVGSHNYDVNNTPSVGNVSLYEYKTTDAKIYNSWDLYLKDKTTAESGLNINDLTNIEVYIAEDKNNPHTASTNNNVKFTQNNIDSTLDQQRPLIDFFGRFDHGLGIFGKFDNQKSNSRTYNKYIVNSPDYKEYLSGSVNGDIFIHPPASSSWGNIIKIPIIESGYYVIYNSFIWPYQTPAPPAGITFFTGNNTTVTKKGTTYQFNSISSNDLNNSYKIFLKYYSGDNGSTTNYDAINGLELGYLNENSDYIYISSTNEGDWSDENCITRFQIAKRPTTIPSDYKHIVTMYKNQPVCNPWNGTAIDELAPTVYNPLVTYSKYKGRDLEIKLVVTLEDDTTETFYFAGWRLDEVFNFYLKNGVNTLGKVFAKSSLSNNTWFTADNISSYKWNDGDWQWSFTDEDHSFATSDTGFGQRNDTGINNVGVIIASDGAGENIQKLWTRNHRGNNIKNINVSMKKAGIMAVPNGGFETTITSGTTYNDQSAKLYEWDTTTEEYVERTPSSITSSFSPILDTNASGTYIQTYTISYNGESYTTTRTIEVPSKTYSITSNTAGGMYYPSVSKDGANIYTFIDSDWLLHSNGSTSRPRGIAFVIIDITTSQKIESYAFDTFTDWPDATGGNGIQNTNLISWVTNLSSNYSNPNYVIFGAVIEVFYRSQHSYNDLFDAIRNSLGGNITYAGYDSSYAIISRFNSTGTATLLDEKIGSNTSIVTASASI